MNTDSDDLAGKAQGHTEAGILAAEYFAKDVVGTFLPTLVDIRILGGLAACTPGVTVSADSLVSQLKLAKARVLDGIHRLGQEGMLKQEGSIADFELLLTEQGKRYYDELKEGDNSNSKACKLRLVRSLRLSEAQADELLKKMDQWLCQMTPNDIVGLLVGTDILLPAGQEILQQGLGLVRRCRKEAGEAVSPLYLRALGHLASAFAVNTLSEPSGQRVHVIVDTNVLVHLAARSDAPNPARVTLSRILQEAPQTEFLVAKSTLKELLGVLDS